MGLYIFKNIQDNKLKWVLKFLIVFILIAFLSPVIVNNKPLLCKNKNGFYLPVFTKKYFNDECSFQIETIIPYTANTIDKKNRNVGPFDKQNLDSIHKRHWLGTDALGRDVLAGLIRGSLFAFWIGMMSAILALLIGFTMAFLSGFVVNAEPASCELLFYIFYFFGNSLSIFY